MSVHVCLWSTLLCPADNFTTLRVRCTWTFSLTPISLFNSLHSYRNSSERWDENENMWKIPLHLKTFFHLRIKKLNTNIVICRILNCLENQYFKDEIKIKYKYINTQSKLKSNSAEGKCCSSKDFPFPYTLAQGEATQKIPVLPSITRSSGK